MTRTLESGLLLLSLAAIACGGTGPKSNAAPPGAPGQPAIESPTTPPPDVSNSTTDPTASTEPQLASLRLLGVANPGFDAVVLDLAEVSIEVDGAPLAIDLSRVTTMDLTRADQAWDLGTFALPPPGTVAHVRIVLDDVGAWEEGAEAGALDVCGLPIEFDAPAEWLALRGHAVVHLDLSRSILKVDAQDAILLPQLQVRY
ncbi:hypothetical protein [Anaeromyxobacter terrae]|uniref:hypothetical protein n=1 Tax=Anaeromyxobacter terrae TaxID=2925406 RepID=UPI001F565605|nr:hypothetical protein [Anaeromyxobacter sp. SG22]